MRYLFPGKVWFSVSVVIVFCLLSTEPAFSGIKFNNFGQLESLTAGQDGDYYRKNGQQIKVFNRLVIKKDKQLTISELKALDRSIRSVKTLYQGNEFDYVSAELLGVKPTNTLINNLLINTGILLVQPDILQLQNKSHYIENSVLNGRLIEKLRINNNDVSYQGKGVKVAIIDDGIELAHPALNHKKPVFQYDMEVRTQDASPKLDIDTHGTKVAGVIFAHGDDVIGIAPNAELIAIRQPSSVLSETILAFYIAKLSGADVVNCSWHTNWLLQPIEDVVNDLATTGRQGKGIAVVFAAGNEGRPVHDKELEGSINSAIVVGVAKQDGSPQRFSNYGDSVDLYVPVLGLMTTAINGQFTWFSGTSLAASIVSGQIAGLLAFKPDMTLSDIVNTLKQRYSKPKTQNSDLNYFYY